MFYNFHFLILVPLYSFKDNVKTFLNIKCGFKRCQNLISWRCQCLLACSLLFHCHALYWFKKKKGIKKISRHMNQHIPAGSFFPKHQLCTYQTIAKIKRPRTIFCCMIGFAKWRIRIAMPFTITYRVPANFGSFASTRKERKKRKKKKWVDLK